MSAPGSVLAALRSATAPAHRRLEAVMDLDSDRLTPTRYAAALQVLHAVRAGWEPELEVVWPGSTGAHRLWLLQDLAHLGADPLPPAAPLRLGPAAAWGVRYVLEGSALGGRVLLRRAERMGFTAAAGARYFAGAGADTGPHWKRFLAELDGVGTATTTPAIVAGAVLAFERLAAAASARFDEGLDPRQDLAPPLAAVEDAVVADPRL